MSTLCERVLSFFSPSERENASVLVAFSGGADSTALLLCLWTLHRNGAFRAVRAFHFHHGIRGAEADRDERFCRDLCARYGIPYDTARADVPAIARREGMSKEDAARRERYAALRTFCEKNGTVDFVATAHHAGDVAETVLFRLARGTGADGIAALAPRRALCPGTELIRPLLHEDRETLRDYVLSQNETFVQDSTNDVPDASRNRLRLETLPSLETVHPGASRHLCTFAELCACDRAYFGEQVDAFLGQYGTLVPVDALKALHPAVSGRVLSALCERKTGFPPERIHVERMTQALTQGGEVRKTGLPGGLAFLCDGTYCCVMHTKEAEQYLFPKTEPVYLAAGETYAADGITVGYGTEEKDVTQFTEKINKIFIRARIKSDKIKGGVFIRFRSAHTMEDEYVCGGHRHRVKDLLSEGKAAPILRGRIPLFCDGDGILWAPFCRVRDGAEAKPGEDAAVLTVLLDL